MSRRREYSEYFIAGLVKEKETMTISQIADKYDMTHHQVTYVIYKKGKDIYTTNGKTKQKLYQDLKKVSDEVNKKNTVIAKIIKALRL